MVISYSLYGAVCGAPLRRLVTPNAKKYTNLSVKLPYGKP